MVTSSLPLQSNKSAGQAQYSWLQEPVGLYLHIPFCEAKCIYCDFNSYARMEDKFEPFVRAICDDITRGVSWDLPGTPDCYGSAISTIFLGGGTPSVLEPEQISRILEAVRGRYAVVPDAEVTMEANPGTISLDKFSGYLRAGINRLSMGVQVLDNEMLQKIGRIHTAEQAEESYRLARLAGFGNINLDFIFGLPGQDLAHLERTLDRLLSIEPLPDHLSCYSLIVEEKTPLFSSVKRGLLTVPDDDAVAEMYERLGERLAASGYTQYEISNWTLSKPCRHNLIYWHDQRYLAFGPGASGYWANQRYSTVLAPGSYIKRVTSGASVIAERTQVSEVDEMAEFMMMGLRLNTGVSRAEFLRRFERDLDSVYGKVVADLTSLSVLEDAGDALRLSVRGRLLGNEAFSRFI